MTAIAKAGLCQKKKNLELQPGLPHGSRDQTVGLSSKALTGTLAGSWTKSGAAEALTSAYLDASTTGVSLTH